MDKAKARQRVVVISTIAQLELICTDDVDADSVGPEAFIRILQTAGATCRENAITAREICDILVVKRSREKYIRQIARHSLHWALENKAPLLPCPAGGSGYFVTDNLDEVKGWARTNAASAFAILTEVRSLFPDLVQEHQNASFLTPR